MNFVRPFWCVLFFTFLFLTEAKAQETFVRKISFLEGLPTQVIYDLHISKNGLLFMGTNKGLISFNGVDFKEYEINDNIALSMSEIKNDANGTLWCKNFSNQLFYLEANELHLFQPLENYFKTSNDNLISYFFTPKNELFVLTEFNLLQVLENGSVSVVFTNEYEYTQFSALDYDPQNNILKIASSEHVFTLKDNTLSRTINVSKGQKEVAFTAYESLYTLKGFKNQVFTENGKFFDLKELESRTYFFHFSRIG